jgi:hypothetical protein
MDQKQGAQHPKVFCAAILCDEIGCETRVKILAVVDVGPDNQPETAQRTLAIALPEYIYEGIACPKGHPFEERTWGAKVRVRPEPNWM